MANRLIETFGENVLSAEAVADATDKAAEVKEDFMAQPEIVDRSLMTAHNCMLDALKVQSEHFNIDGLEDAIQVCYRDFLRVWSPDSPLLKA